MFNFSLVLLRTCILKMEDKKVYVLAVFRCRVGQSLIYPGQLGLELKEQICCSMHLEPFKLTFLPAGVSSP